MKRPASPWNASVGKGNVMRARVACIVTGAALVCVVGSVPAQPSNPLTDSNPPGPVQGYQGGYDPTDKSKAPAVRSGAPSDTANPDEGGTAGEVTGWVVRVDNAAMTLILEGGHVFTLPPTVEIDRAGLRPGTPVRVSFQRREGVDLATAVRIAEGIPR
jgi:hypothetical protein